MSDCIVCLDLAEVVVVIQGHNRALWVRGVRLPLLERNSARLDWFWHLDPLSTHLGIKLHFNGAFSEVVASEQYKHYS